MDGTFDEWVDKGCKADADEVKALLAELARLDPVDYDLKRKAFAKEHGLQLKTVDAEVEKLRGAREPEEKRPEFEVIDPCEHPVSGSDLLDTIRTTVERFCILPDHCAPVMAAWIAHAWCHDAADISPVLAFTSPEKRCGKSTAMSVVGALVPKPMHAVSLTAAVLFRVIEIHKPTLLIDEADTFLEAREEMRGMINGGHNRQTAYVWRTVGDDHKPKQFGVWAPKAVAMIGALPETLEDRSLVVPLKRKESHEVTERFNSRRNAELLPIRQMLARWAEDNMLSLENQDPAIPDALNDRAQDNARCLCALADLAGGEWPELLRQSLVGLAQLRADDTPASKGVMLLRDIGDILERWKGDRIKSSDLVAELVAIEDGPWEVWRGGEPITTRMVASLLKPYDVRPQRDMNARFYNVTDLSNAVGRYVT